MLYLRGRHVLEAANDRGGAKKLREAARPDLGLTEFNEEPEKLTVCVEPNLEPRRYRTHCVTAATHCGTGTWHLCHSSRGTRTWNPDRGTSRQVLFNNSLIFLILDSFTPVP